MKIKSTKTSFICKECNYNVNLLYTTEKYRTVYFKCSNHNCEFGEDLLNDILNIQEWFYVPLFLENVLISEKIKEKDVDIITLHESGTNNIFLRVNLGILKSDKFKFYNILNQIREIYLSERSISISLNLKSEIIIAKNIYNQSNFIKNIINFIKYKNNNIQLNNIINIDLEMKKFRKDIFLLNQLIKNL